MKKALSLVLAMLMLMSVFSASAFAATTPVITEAYAGYFGATLIWSADVGAAGYGVYRFDSDNAEAELIADVATTSYIDKTVAYGKTYKYVIASKNIDGSFEPVNIQDAALVEYDRVKVRKVFSDYEGVNLTWNATPVAKNGYAIFRQVGNAKPAYLTSVKGTSYIDADVSYKGQYRYNIVSLDEYGNYAEALIWGNAIKVNYNLIDVKVPTATNAGVELIWTKVDGAKGYDIYRKSNKPGDEGALIGSTTDVCKFTDKAVEKGVTYTYCVIVKDSGATPDYANGRSIKYTVAKFLKHVNQFDGLKVEWTPVANASKYYLYKDGSFVAELATTSYLDKDVENGRSYKYSLDVQFKNGVLASFSYDSLVDSKYYNDANDYVNGFRYKKPVCSRVGVNDAGITVHTFDPELDKAIIDSEPTVYDVGYKHYICAECGMESTKKVITQLAPKTPAILSLSNTNLGVKLTWEVVDGADLYVVYRRATINGNASGWQIFKILTGTAVYDNTVKTGGFYRYAVKAVRRTSYASPLAVDKAAAENTLSWATNFAKANSYFVYRKDNAGSNFWNTLALIDNSTAYYSVEDGKYITTFTDTNPNPKATGYCVRGALSSALGSGQYIRAVEQATGLTVKNNLTGILFSWDKVAGATSYRVYRKLASDESWTLMGYTTKTYYPDYETESGNTYLYTVMTVCNGDFGSYNRAGAEITRLDAPKAVSAKSTKDGILFNYEQVNGGVRYNIYRKTANSNWVMIGKINDLKSTTYLDASAKKGVTYTYTVRAVDGLTAGEGVDMSAFDAGVSCKELY